MVIDTPTLALWAIMGPIVGFLLGVGAGWVLWRLKG